MSHEHWKTALFAQVDHLGTELGAALVELERRQSHDHRWALTPEDWERRYAHLEEDE